MKKQFNAIVLCAVLLVSATFVNAEGEIPIGGLANPQTVETEVKAKDSTVWDFFASVFGFKP